MPAKYGPSARHQRGRVAVVGAGVSGLAAARCLRDEGIEPVVFEQAGEIGGVWNFHEEEPGGGSPAYRSLRTNTSRQTTAFSDFPFPAAWPDFPARAQVLAYLNEYADRFALRDAIRLRTRVDAVVPDGSTGAAGAANWEVTYYNDAGSAAGAAGTVGRETFDGVLVCSGLYGSPVLPHYAGAADYRGALLHSRDYKGPEGFEGKEVVVVGAGSSGADIAVELSQVARRLTLSTANGAWFVPRYISDRPYDHRLTRLAGLVPYRLRMRLFQRLLFAEYVRMGIGKPAQALRGVLPTKPLDVLTERITASSEVPRRIATGLIVPKPGIARLEERHVVYTDSTRSPVDVIVLASGYNISFPFLARTLANPSGGRIDLYKHVFHPDQPGLAFLGLCIVAGPVIPVIELQARWAARVLAGTVTLPPRAQMHTEIRARRAWMARIGAQPMRVQLIEYMDDIAREIGARPQLVRHPALALPLIVGPPAAAQYRLDGPGRWDHAAQAIREANARPPARRGTPAANR
jgi:dimethylaniline monooxygenase (N-oxide forming)